MLVLAATACGSGEKKAASSLQDEIKVTGAFAQRPTIDIAAPLNVEKSEAWSKPGKGDRVGSQATTILQLTLADGQSGKTVISTLDRGQQPLEAQLGNQVFPSLTQALTGKSAGSRVVVASTSDDAYGDSGSPQIGIKGGDPVVMVADILSTDPASVLDGPSGATLPAPATAPRLKEANGAPVGLDFVGLRKPAKLVVIPLREGTGPAVDRPDRIVADYLGQVWNAAKPFEETFTKEPAKFSIGISKVIKAWDLALAGQKEGARVMLICPPALAYGSAAQPNIPANSTLVFVIDVLGVG